MKRRLKGFRKVFFKEVEFNGVKIIDLEKVIPDVTTEENFKFLDILGGVAVSLIIILLILERL